MNMFIIARALGAAVLAAGVTALLTANCPGMLGGLLPFGLCPLAAFTAYVATIVLHPEPRTDGKK